MTACASRRASARPWRSLGRLGDHLLQPPEVARLEQGERELGKDLLAQRVVVRCDTLCAGEQVDGRGHVAARESPAPCRCESRGCSAPERDGALAPLAELGQRRVRTFEVEPHDLLSLSHPLPGLALDPRREPFMQVRASSLGDPAVRGVDREDVREAKGILVAQCRAIRNDQLLPGQCLEVAADVSPLLLRRERGYGSPPEDSPDDRRALDNGPLFALEPVEARGEERVDRRRDPEARQIAYDDPAPVAPLEQAVVDEHPQGLADEQRVPFGRLGDPRACVFGELPPAEQVADQAVGLGVRQRRERDERLVRLAGEPAPARLHQLGSRQEEQHDRYAANPVGEVLEQVEERRRRPLDVVEDHEERPSLGERLEELPNRPKRLVDARGCRGKPEEAAEPVADERRVGRTLEEKVQLSSGLARRIGIADARGTLQQLRDRPEGDPLPVRQAAPADDGRALADRRDQLAGEP